MQIGQRTPWGPAHNVTTLGPAVQLVDTASHGGLHLEERARNAVPAEVGATLMNGPEWAEEDCELPIVLSLLLGAQEIDVATLWTTAERVHETGAAAARNYERYHPTCRHLPERAHGNNEAAH